MNRLTRHRLERGSSVVSLLLIFLPILFCIDMITAIAIGGYAQVNVAASARNCVRMAAATLSGTLGPVQGRQLGIDTLKLAGLSKRDPQVTVSVDNWTRTGTVSCSSSVTVPFGALGLFARLVGVHDVTLREKASAAIESWNSRWDN